ncbi:MAG TPA: alpha/beta hydrolase [Bosea sp. (in: a-proteobacteria)]|jgi:pimeloyl-ACP methyl ester carboxylesterase|uniref:alpha/beta hydrolase n=1 Tax=Bosea sp. (in: a-proteobacteria) TaxID=1871050 RepID=UPI002E14FAEA|nr:alpha/beta hydrolase [Bosea sp. (in: a-proteobacteria)]
MSEAAVPRTIVLIHGAWLNSLSWEKWKAHYEAHGHSVLAPDWPGAAGAPAQLRANPPAELTKHGPREIVEHLAGIVSALPTQPILIGHSAGAVFVQHLLDRGLGSSGIAINPAPTPGVIPGLDSLVSAWPVLGDPFSGKKVMQMTPRFFARRFANTLSAEEAPRQYDRYIVPTAGKVYWDGVLAGGAGPINWASTIRPPLLLIGGGQDKIADPGTTQRIFEKQKRAASPTAFRLFAQRSHWTCMDPGWVELADLALDWARTASVRAS